MESGSRIRNLTSAARLTFTFWIRLATTRHRTKSRSILTTSALRALVPTDANSFSCGQIQPVAVVAVSVTLQCRSFQSGSRSWIVIRTIRKKELRLRQRRLLLQTLQKAAVLRGGPQTGLLTKPGWIGPG